MLVTLRSQRVNEQLYRRDKLLQFYYNLKSCITGLFYFASRHDMASTCELMMNPLTPRSDSRVTSPYNIHPLSRKQVMRILKCITRNFSLQYPSTIQETGNENTQMYQVQVVILI